MKTTYLSSTDLKRRTAEILNLVAYGDTIAIVKRHNEPLVKIVPAKKEEGSVDLEKKLKKYFGSIPNFPFPGEARYFRRRKITL